MPETPVMEPAYKSHPLYRYRRILLINVLVSIIFGSFALANAGYMIALWIFHLIFMLVSGFICLYDLIKWVSKKATNSDDEPKWPLKFVMVVDALLAMAFLWTYLCELMDSDTSYYSRCSGTFAQAYASLTILVAALLHGYCFWIQVMTIKKRQWAAKLPSPTQPCFKCGSPGSHPESEPNLAQQLFPHVFTSRSTTEEPDIEIAAECSVPNSSTRSACHITPVTDDEDETLSDLIRAERCGRYGTMRSVPARGESPVPHNHEDVPVVKKKNKKSSKNKLSKAQGKA